MNATVGQRLRPSVQAQLDLEREQMADARADRLAQLQLQREIAQLEATLERERLGETKRQFDFGRAQAEMDRANALADQVTAAGLMGQQENRRFQNLLKGYEEATAGATGGTLEERRKAGVAARARALSSALGVQGGSTTMGQSAQAGERASAMDMTAELERQRLSAEQQAQREQRILGGRQLGVQERAGEREAALQVQEMLLARKSQNAQRNDLSLKARLLAMMGGAQ